MANLHYFYVLLCRDQSLYGGYTTDLKRREQEHNKGIGAKYTRAQARRPVKLIYAECFETRSDAMRAEALFKQQTRAQKDQYLANQGVRVPYDRCYRSVMIDKRGAGDESTE